MLRPHARLLGEAPRVPTLTSQAVVAGYRQLLTVRRGRRTYPYVFANAVFHSGIFTWLGLYFVQRHGLGEIGIGLALLGYGVPGFLLGPVIGRAADRWGRRRLIPIGVAVAAASAALLIPALPLIWAVLAARHRPEQPAERPPALLIGKQYAHDHQRQRNRTAGAEACQ